MPEPAIPEPRLPVAKAWASVPHTDADLVLITTPDGVCLEASSTVEQMLGLRVGDVVGRAVVEVVGELDAASLQAVFARVRRDGSARTTIRLTPVSAPPLWLDVSAKVVTKGESDLVVFAARDVTDDVLALEHLAESEQRWRLAFEHSPIGAALVSTEGEILLANGSLAKMLGRRVEALVLLSMDDVTHPDDVLLDAAKLAELRAGELKTYSVEKRYLTATGEQLWGQLTAAAVPNLHGEVHGIIVQLQDVTQRRDAELELANRALHDPLTGLANRFLVQQWLTSALQEHLGRGVGVLYCDLDRFKVVNDSLGHGAGDDVLVEAAARLCAAVRPEDLVGRVGGDEFVVICERVAGPEALLGVAARLAEALDEPIKLAGHTHTVTLSIGAAIGTATESADELLMRGHGAVASEASGPSPSRVLRRDG